MSLNEISSEFGDYSRQVVIEVRGKRIQCDWELATEIAYLNLRGIKTVASCSGHGKLPSNICVSENHEQDMIDLGYESEINEFGVLLFRGKTDSEFKFLPEQED